MAASELHVRAHVRKHSKAHEGRLTHTHTHTHMQMRLHQTNGAGDKDHNQQTPVGEAVSDGNPCGVQRRGRTRCVVLVWEQHVGSTPRISQIVPYPLKYKAGPAQLAFRGRKPSGAADRVWPPENSMSEQK